MFRVLSFFILLPFFVKSYGQIPDVTYMPSIQGIKLFVQGNQLGYPIINVNSTEGLELHFDDMDGRIKNYYYTFQLCNADWVPADLSTFDYLKGFSTIRITQYRQSSISLTKYIHYQAVLPDRNCVPTQSGNYLLKVFLDNDTSKLAFTRRVLVYEKQAEAGLTITQPFNSEIFKTHQRLQFQVSMGQLNVINPTQQIKTVVLQNYRWDNAKINVPPTFIRGNSLEYSTEDNLVFPAGKEYRWVDLRSFHYQSERISRAELLPGNINVYVQPDADRTNQRYLKFTDYNGFYFIESTEVSNPWWQSDYATVHFTFVPRGNQPYADKNIFISGELTKYNFNDTSAMTYNAEKGIYEKTLYLKQGYYSYAYVTKDAHNPAAPVSNEQTEGNYWETENNYTVLVYYRSLSGRHDELIGFSNINSLNSRTIGF